MNKLSDLKFLVVDESKIMNEVLSQMLKSITSHKVTSCFDGAHAWEILLNASEQATPYHCVVASSHCNSLSGVELLKKIRSTEPIKSTPLILSVSESEETTVQAFAENAHCEVLCKPFGIEKLRTALQALLCL